MSIDLEQEARLLLNLEAAGVDTEDAVTAARACRASLYVYSKDVLALSERCTALEQQLADAQKENKLLETAGSLWLDRAEFCAHALKKYSVRIDEGTQEEWWAEVDSALYDAQMEGDSDAD